MLNEISPLTSLFTDTVIPDPHQTAAVELGIILLLDPSAAPDLIRMLFAGRKVDFENWASVHRLSRVLLAYGVVEEELVPGDQQRFMWKFRARPLVQMLKRMAHRDPETGLTLASPKLASRQS